MGRGIAFPSISRGQLENIVIPLPPLAEQRRIVAKVDELMALCDRLEAAQAERESRRDRLVRSSLHRLNQPAEGPAFRDDARFTLDHLPRLTARPEHVPQLRQTILNLAVHGKLVLQDPKDEPASELLKRIRTERERMAMVRNANKRTPSSIASDGGELFEIPSSWRWVCLGEIAFGFRYGTSMKCGYEPEGEPVLRIPNIDNGRINVDDLKFGPLPAREAADLRLELGDILMVRSNGSLSLVGRPALVESNAVGFCYAGYLVRVRTARDFLDSRYLVLALSTEHVREQIEVPIRTAVGLKNVNATELSGLMLPLASPAEQRRIVAKVDELMAVCDRLEAQLTTAQAVRRRLLESVLHEALASPRL
jgi:type I restriction enzyme S subunit